MSHLDGWIVFVHKVVLDELDGESALPHTSCSDHHQLVLGHVCGGRSRQVAVRREAGVSGVRVNGDTFERLFLPDVTKETLTQIYYVHGPQFGPTQQSGIHVKWC